MYRVLTNITIKQNPTEDYPLRNKVLNFDFCHEFESEDSWTSFTNKAKITLPKLIYALDENNKPFSLAGVNVNIGGFSTNAPLFLRGDIVTIEAGYKYKTKSPIEIVDTSIMFQGYISKVNSKIPIEIECEDNMWKLKQVQAKGGKNGLFKASEYTLEDILRELIANTGLPYTVNALTKTSIGDFRIESETVCEVLARLRKDYHFESYFRGNELRCGSIVYIEAEAKEQSFSFQQNIISDELEYKRKDDVALSAIAYSINKIELGGLTKSGHKKTRHERLEVLVYWENGAFKSFVKPFGSKADFPPNTGGERRTLYFWNVTEISKLIELAKNELVKYYYTGLKGKFTTFGIPFVRQGDNANISDNILPERNGKYKIKSVSYKGGVEGLRQEIELDYLLNININAGG